MSLSQRGNLRTCHYCSKVGSAPVVCLIFHNWYSTLESHIIRASQRRASSPATRESTLARSPSYASTAARYSNIYLQWFTGSSVMFSHICSASHRKQISEGTRKHTVATRKPRGPTNASAVAWSVHHARLNSRPDSAGLRAGRRPSLPHESSVWQGPRCTPPRR